MTSTSKMPTSSSPPPTAAAVEDQSPTASDSEEYEYEEIEIEVEEEEVSDEEEKERGKDLSLSIEDRDDENRKKRTIISDDEKFPRSDTGLDESNKVPHSEEQNETRLEVNEGNKQPAVICEFFAKGWCIKGNSCSFRHIKNHMNVDEGVRKDIGQSDLATSEIKPESQKRNHVTFFPFINNHKNYNSSWMSDSKFSTCDWEPSKPFRSVFLISRGILTPDIQYDPFRDSIEPPKIAYKPSKTNTHSPVNVNPSQKETFGTDYGSVKQKINKSKVHVSHYSIGENVGPTKETSHKQKVNFRAALIGFVKELVKPTWRDGKLSKDAHKLIVKKAVDKVVNTLPAENIPNIQESVDIYLSSSQPKLMKLVEGYIEKYGKL